LMQDKTRFEQKSRQKRKPNAVLEKENNRWIIRVKTRVFLTMKNGVSLAPKQTWCDPTIYYSNQNKRKLKAKTTDAPRKTHRIWSNKNIVSWKVTWFLPMKKGCLGGIPKLLRLYLLDISCGDMSIPKLELLSILHHIILQSLQLKTSFIQNFTQFY
jgi:hypothetical protein